MLLMLCLAMQVAASEPLADTAAKVAELNRAAKALGDAAVAKFDRDRAQFLADEAAFKAAQARYQADIAAHDVAMRNYHTSVAASQAATERWRADAARIAKSREPKAAEPPRRRQPKPPVCGYETPTGSRRSQYVCRDAN